MKKLPDGWKEVKLSDILESIENGNRPKGGITDLKDGIPSIGGEHINSTGGFNLKNVRLIPEHFYNSMSRGKIQKEDVLVVKDGATTGKVSLVGSDFPYEDAAVNEHVFILRGKKDLVYQKYLFYHLYSPIGQRQMDANFHGAAIGGINTQFIKNYDLVLPPLPTQKKIAAVLEKAEKFREWRKEADGLTDRFLKSTFLEMFGDPMENPKMWELRKLGEIGEVSSGLTLNGQRSADKNNMFPYLRVANVFRNILDLKEIKYIHASDSEYNKFLLRKNDILIVEGHGNIEEIGRAAIWKGEIPNCLHQNHLIRVRLDNKYMNPYFLSYFLNGYGNYGYFSSESRTTSGLNTISTNKVREAKVSLPPISLQQKFASIVQQVEQVRQHQKESKQQIDHFFNMLMQKAFNGELEL
ncbi:restriction endonuclease S subunit [groundwater metagenome]